MVVTLEKAVESDANAIFVVQVNAFTPLLEKYKDFNTNPANETIVEWSPELTTHVEIFIKLS